MESRVIDGLTLFFPAEERAAAELTGRACTAGITLIGNLWGVRAPKDVRVYVVNSSWLRAMFHAAPWRWRPSMVVSLPLWYPRGRRLWQVAGGWQQQLGSRRVICVKPPRFLAQAATSPGDRIFIREDDPEAKVQQIAVHELTHACTAHLKLPPWLNEGLAMVSAECFAGKPMVRRDSLALVEQPIEIKISPSRQAVKPGGLEAVVALSTRGYWRTRYLEETRPGLLRDVLAQPRPHDWEQAIAAACHVEDGSFWPEMDATIVTYFDQHATRWVPSATANESTHRITHGSRG